MPRPISASFSATRKWPTSVSLRSTSSIRKTLANACRKPEDAVVAEVAAVAVAEVAAGSVVAAVSGSVAAEAAAAAVAGLVASGSVAARLAWAARLAGVAAAPGERAACAKSTKSAVMTVGGSFWFSFTGRRWRPAGCRSRESSGRRRARGTCRPRQHGHRFHHRASTCAAPLLPSSSRTGSRFLFVGNQNSRMLTMKGFSLLALATAIVLSASFAYAQQNEDGNGLSLGKSMPGSTAGVPYPDRATTPRNAPVAVGGEMGHGTAHHRRHRKHHHRI